MKPLARPLQAGDALQVVWRPEQPRDGSQHGRQSIGAGTPGTADGKRSLQDRRGPSEWWRQDAAIESLVYDCTVMQVVSVTAESTVVHVRMLKPDGALFAEQQLALTTDTLCSLKEISSSSVHLSWALKGQQPDRPKHTPSVSPPALTHSAPSSTKPPDARSQQAGCSSPPVKRSKPAAGSDQQAVTRQQMEDLQKTLRDLQSKVLVLTGRMDAYDVTASRMTDYAVQQARLFAEVRKLKKAVGLDATPADGALPPADAGPNTAAAASLSDPLCSKCAKRVAYDMPLRQPVGVLMGPAKADLGNLFTLPGGRVKANSALKKLVQCDDCSQKGAPRLVVCTSGGAGNRLSCHWCRCKMTTNTTDAISGWCGKRHSNCRQLVIENETDRQGNTLFLTKGLAPLREVVAYDEVKLMDVDLSAYNNCDYVIVATSSLSRALVMIEIDNQQHAGGGQYAPELEAQKNTGNFASAKDYDEVLFLRVNPCGRYKMAGGEEACVDKKARWLVARDWIACFLRAPWGAWTLSGDTHRSLVYLYYDHDSPLLDRRPAQFTTTVAYSAPALPAPASPDLADWGCTTDPYLVIKASPLARECLALSTRHPQPART